MLSAGFAFPTMPMTLPATTTEVLVGSPQGALRSVERCCPKQITAFKRGKPIEDFARDLPSSYGAGLPGIESSSSPAKQEGKRARPVTNPPTCAM